jgi:hypothetical protein
MMIVNNRMGAITSKEVILKGRGDVKTRVDSILTTNSANTRRYQGWHEQPQHKQCGGVKRRRDNEK